MYGNPINLIETSISLAEGSLLHIWHWKNGLLSTCVDGFGVFPLLELFYRYLYASYVIQGRAVFPSPGLELYREC